MSVAKHERQGMNIFIET